MNISESVALLTLSVSVAGGVLGSFRGMDAHFSHLRGNFDLLKWRLEKIEDSLKEEVKGHG